MKSVSEKRFLKQAPQDRSGSKDNIQVERLSRAFLPESTKT